MNVIVCGIKLLKCDVLYFLIVCNLCISATNCRSINRDRSHSLPIIPDVVHPPIPVGFNLDEDAEELQDLEEYDPEVRPGLFQGDMALNNEIYNYWRVGLRWDVFPEKLWKNRTVPYVISPLYETEHYITIYQAIQTLNFMTCVKFVPWDGKAKDYLLIWPVKYPSGCWSYVGRYGGPQILSLQPPDDRSTNCLGSEGRALHELLHALGIFHEQSRADRDKFVKIHLDNVIPQYRVNFDKQSLENTTYSFEYDYDSIMHYGRTFFSISKSKPTISVKQKGKTIGQRKMLSKTDCLKVNDLYGCLGTPPNYRRKFYTLCNFMGI
ncbi:hatching enzyme 1.2-like [Planococcus citri]|uniref:hatching enzyme 1.2-like n=1 Tax=Planococcus citri TaxID=170843 RepID=UPI0031F7B475